MSLLNNYVTYVREFVALGGVECAVYLSTLIWNRERWQDDDGWMPSNPAEITRITGLSANQQMTARIMLRGQGIIQDKPVKGTIEPIIRIDLDTLAERLAGGGS